jgi:hypothetical protein
VEGGIRRVRVNSKDYERNELNIYNAIEKKYNYDTGKHFYANNQNYVVFDESRDVEKFNI